MDYPKEECGVVAAYHMRGNGQHNVYPYVVKALLELQNRGQLSAGLTTYNPTRNRILQTHKGTGSVNEVFQLANEDRSQHLMEEYSGIAAIGHNRYATSGKADMENAQPFERPHGRMWKWFAIAFNGNLANYDALKAELEQSGYHLTYHSDTEVMMHQINREMRGDEQPDFKVLFSNLARTFDGAYNIAFINARGDLVVMRDPLGIKPMAYGVKGDLLVAASESVVLSNLDMEFTMLEPGEMLVANREGYRVERFWPQQKPAHCFFEWVYFANLATNMEGRSVYKVRHNIGAELAQQEGPDNPRGDLVVAVPETANTVANSFAYHMGLPRMEGLLRNRYIGRTFIEGHNRKDTVRLKFTPLPEILEGRRIYLVDDTIVRSTTLRTVVEYLRERGRVEEVHVRIGCPPIMAPCFYGIDMSTVKELFAPQYVNGKGPAGGPDEAQLQRMAGDLAADSLGYLSTDGLVRALDLPRDRLCMACLDANYPTPVGQHRYAQAMAVAQAPEAVGHGDD